MMIDRDQATERLTLKRLLLNAMNTVLNKHLIYIEI